MAYALTSAIGVVVYYPTPEVLAQLTMYSKAAQRLYIVNNSSAQSVAFLRPLLEHSNVVLLQNPDNLGIARALNQLLEQARHEHMDYLFLFDQDSVPQGDMLLELLQTIIHSSAAIVTPKHVDGEGKSLKTSYTFFDSVMSITSGMLLELRNIPEYIKHDENLFIDYVDIDFILKCFLKGVKIEEHKTAKLNHNLGEPKAIKIGNIKLHSTNHNLIRRFYIARNRMIILKRYFNLFPIWTVMEARKYITEMVKIIIVDKEPKKIVSTVRGVWHGILFVQKRGD